MKRILFVDDDPLVARIYKEALSRQGFVVDPALDGSSALKILQDAKPDLIVLDLMMPKNQGVELLNFVRSDSKFASLPVIAFSNSYIENPPRQNGSNSLQKTLLKVRCTPSILLGVIHELLPGQNAGLFKSAPASAIATPGGSESKNEYRAKPPSFEPRAADTKVASAAVVTDEEFRAKARQHFFQKATQTCEGLRETFQAFARANTDAERDTHLQSLYRKIHFLAASAGLAECYPIARMASVFEAMLFEITNKSAIESPSVRRTMAQATDFFGLLFKKADQTGPDIVPASRVLVVDDDALSNRVVVSALRHAQLQAVSTEDPLKALEWLKAQQYALVLLDIEMPGMDGFELCKRIRQLPGYAKTPIIYVTSHSDFESRTRSALAGGDDLISKPVFHMELAVKAMTHLLKKQLVAT